jgi:hypothetical protein
MSFEVKEFECIYCCRIFTRAAAIKAEVSEVMASMYCSKECHDKDSEAIDVAIAQAQAQQAVKEAEFKDEDYHYIEAGGFKLKIPIKKES